VTRRVDRPLEGVGVVVTRPDDADAELPRALEELGARVLRWPTTRWAPPADPGPLDDAVRRMDEFRWVVFTSPRAVQAVAERMDRLPAGVRVAVVGRTTGARVQHAGWSVDVIPEVQTAAALVEAMAGAGLEPDERVLFPASEIARDTLEAGLARLAARVTRVTAYRTLPAPLDGEACARALARGEVQVISLTSPSSLEYLRSALGEEGFRAAAEGTVLAAIGPTTAAAVRAAGARQVIEAQDHSVPGLARRIAEWGEDNLRGAR
jgi:uroporphyrinogen-III synthase